MLDLPRLLKSFTYALKGLYKVFREEQNLRIQGTVAILVIALSFYFQIKPIEWCLILVCITMVLLMEILNSAVERVADVLRPRINNYVKEIKDIAAAAVMMAAIVSGIIGMIIFLPYLFK